MFDFLSFLGDLVSLLMYECCKRWSKIHHADFFYLISDVC